MAKYRTYTIADEYLMELLAKGVHHYEILGGAIPKDSRIANVRRGWRGNTEILVESEEFQDIPAGSEIPHVDTVAKTIEK